MTIVVDPELRRSMRIAAAMADKSVRAWTVEILRKAAKAAESEFDRGE